MKNKTLLVIFPGSNACGNTVFNLVVAETGEHLASHFCSEAPFAKGDLYYCKPERIEEYKERFGEVEIKFIDHTDITEEELIKRNGEYYENRRNNAIYSRWIP